MSRDVYGVRICPRNVYTSTFYSPLVLGVGRHKTAPSKRSILSISTTCPFGA